MTYILFYTYELRINSKINLKAWYIKFNIIPSAVRLIKSATETIIRNCIMNSMCNMHANLPFHGNYAADVRPVTPTDCGLQSDFPLKIKLHKKILEGNFLACVVMRGMYSYQQYVKLHQWYLNDRNLPFHGNYAADVRPVTPTDCGLQSDFPLKIKLHKKILEGNFLACVVMRGMYSYQQYVKLHQWYLNDGTLLN